MATVNEPAPSERVTPFPVDGPEYDGSALGLGRRHRYPWAKWGRPGAGPFYVPEAEVPRRRLSGVLRTWGARRGLEVRMIHHDGQPGPTILDAEGRPIRTKVPKPGLTFQFGPPFAPAMDEAAVIDVPPGSACPACGQPVPPHLTADGLRAQEASYAARPARRRSRYGSNKFRADAPPAAALAPPEHPKPEGTQ